ncbi:MAG: tRNA (N6-isopentenyl adenosine(37)-C2)-methylthiotransferase MiaB [bacterium]
MKAYIKTFGCQMNEHDSERMRGLLLKMGYTMASDEEEADFILINTCSIREKAEQKAFSHLGRLKLIKSRRPDLRIGICGCIAQREGSRIIRRAPHVDLIFGTKNIHRLPQLIEKMLATRFRVVEISDDRERWQQFGCEIERDNRVSAWVTIMQGCNNYCTYCVVPYVRGGEWSRPAEDILAEITGLAARGYKEVTLLGHNVNSYGWRGAGQEFDFPRLIRAIDRIPGIERIRFTTSHPKDFSERLIEALADCPKVCEHIHLPFQSGSDKILKSMNRKYTVAEYLDKVNLLRARIPKAGITSDVIVGFPGEEEEDFQQTLHLIESVQFEGLFTFLYSRRPQTAAGNFPRQIPNNIKQKRFEILLEIQNRISSERNESLVGTQQEVLVEEGITARDSQSGEEGLLRGRTRMNKIVEFTGRRDQIGTLRKIAITRANRFNLEGVIVP